MPYLVRAAFEIPKMDVRGLLRPLLTTALALGVAEAFGGRIEIESWLELIAGAALSTLAGAPVVFLLGFDREQRRQAIGRLRTVLGFLDRLRRR